MPRSTPAALEAEMHAELIVPVIGAPTIADLRPPLIGAPTIADLRPPLTGAATVDMRLSSDPALQPPPPMDEDPITALDPAGDIAAAIATPRVHTDSTPEIEIQLEVDDDRDDEPAPAPNQPRRVRRATRRWSSRSPTPASRRSRRR